MAHYTSHHEIVLFTNTRFSQKALVERNKDQNLSTQHENLEKACWNGLLIEILPELKLADEGSKLFVWQVFSGKSYLLVDLAEGPSSNDALFSIDPYLFVPAIHFN